MRSPPKVISTSAPRTWPSICSTPTRSPRTPSSASSTASRSRPATLADRATSERHSSASRRPCVAATTRTSRWSASRTPPNARWSAKRLKLAEEEIAAAAERERNLASRVLDRAAWETERPVLRERAAELNPQLSTRRREHPRVARATGALPHGNTGRSPNQPRAPRTWQQAATRIEALLTPTRALDVVGGQYAASCRVASARPTARLVVSTSHGEPSARGSMLN